MATPSTTVTPEQTFVVAAEQLDQLRDTATQISLAAWFLRTQESDKMLPLSIGFLDDIAEYANSIKRLVDGIESAGR